MKSNRLEELVGAVLQVGVIASSVCLGLGLALSFLGIVRGADLLLQIGIITLLGTPVARVVVSIVEYVTEHDWTFVMLTSIVLLELMASIVAAFAFNR